MTVPDIVTGAEQLDIWPLRARRAIAIAVAVGVALRFAALAQNRSLWRDEASLVFNLRHRGVLGFATPLDHDQGAPPGFFSLAQNVGGLLGGSELAYRAVPFAASCAALVLAAVLFRRRFTPIAAVVAVALLALSPALVFYATQVKQYSLDVALALAVLLVADEAARRQWSTRSCLALAAMGAVAVLCSHPSTFVLAPVGIAAAISARTDRQALLRLVAVGATWAGVWLGGYLAWARSLNESAFLRDYWAAGFLPLPPITAADLYQWRAVLGTIYEPLLSPPAMAFGVTMSLIGLWQLWRRQSATLALLVAPWFLVVLASSFELYPAVERMVLFVVPAVAVTIGVGAEQLGVALSKHRARLPPLPAVLLIILVLPTALARTLEPPHEVEELRPLLAQVRGGVAGDTVLVTRTAQAAWDYYAHRLDLSPGRVVRADAGHRNAAVAAAAVATVDGEAAVWVVDVAFWQPRGSLDPVLVQALDAAGQRLEEHHRPGASVYLYDLSDDAPSASSQ